MPSLCNESCHRLIEDRETSRGDILETKRLPFEQGEFTGASFNFGQKLVNALMTIACLSAKRKQEDIVV